MKSHVLTGLLILAQTTFLYAQEDEFEDFDISQFEEVGSTLKPFCNNKVLGQMPSPLISVVYDVQSGHLLTAGAINSDEANVAEETANISSNNGFRLIGNFPVVSRNNILINLGVSYVHHSYSFDNPDGFNHPLNQNLADRDLKWFNTNLTIFKPLNETTFVLAQLGMEYNGDYNFQNMMSLEHLRFPLAMIYGWKPNDNLMWGLGGTHTYLGGARNLLPVIYYYQTYNSKWGVEALLPARGNVRYRMDSRSLASFGYIVEGATYRMDAMPIPTGYKGPTDFELRRAELRVGFTYQKGLSDFIWISAGAGYRINWLFNAENEGDFLRGFDDSNFYIENQLGNPIYLQFSLSLMSP